MPQNTKNHTIKNFFDEESVDDPEPNETFASPISDNTQSEVDLTTSVTRQPLASSSRQSLRNISQNLSKNSQFASKPGRNLALQKEISPLKPIVTNNKERVGVKNKQSSLLNDEREYLPRRKNQKNDNDTDKNSKRKPKKPRKMVLRDIRKYQNSTDHLIPKLPFSKVIREILLDPSISENGDLRITPKALEALQESAEVYLTIFFEDAYRCTMHRGRMTLIVKDMELVRVLRGVDDLGYRATI